MANNNGPDTPYSRSIPHGTLQCLFHTLSNIIEGIKSWFSGLRTGQKPPCSSCICRSTNKHSPFQTNKLVYEKVQKQNTARDQFRQVVPPSHAPRCLLVVAHSVTSISLVTLNCLMHKHKQSGIVP